MKKKKMEKITIIILLIIVLAVFVPYVPYVIEKNFNNSLSTPLKECQAETTSNIIDKHKNLLLDFEMIHKTGISETEFNSRHFLKKITDIIKNDFESLSCVGYYKFYHRYNANYTFNIRTHSGFDDMVKYIYVNLQLDETHRLILLQESMEQTGSYDFIYNYSDYALFNEYGERFHPRKSKSFMMYAESYIINNIHSTEEMYKFFNKYLVSADLKEVCLERWNDLANQDLHIILSQQSPTQKDDLRKLLEVTHDQLSVNEMIVDHYVDNLNSAQ